MKNGKKRRGGGEGGKWGRGEGRESRNGVRVCFISLSSLAIAINLCAPPPSPATHVHRYTKLHNIFVTKLFFDKKANIYRCRTVFILS